MSDDRAQAFTLEGFIASIVILTAILLALQSVVITPTTGGAVDQEVQSQLRTEAQDVLRVSATNGTENLTYWIRFWNDTGGVDDARPFSYGISEQIGFGSEEPFYRNDTVLGEMLNNSFTQNGRVYNVVLEYRNATNPNESEELRLVYRGVPSDNAIVTAYTVTLYDNMTLTGPGANQNYTLEWYCPLADDSASRGYFPIPDAFGQDYTGGSCSSYPYAPPSDPYSPPGVSFQNDSPIYNIVEVRVVVW